jgi:hypothetical protein
MRGVGHASDCDHHHVLHLALQRNHFLDRAIPALLRWLPPTLQNSIRRLWPGYFLPGNIVLKMLKPGWDKEFATEKAMYERLQPLQGDVIPIYYGEAWCEGTRAIILEDVKGVPPFGQEPPLLSADEFRRRLEVAYQAFCAFGLMTDDIRLANNLILDDKVVFVDLECVFEANDEDRDDWRRTTIGELVDQYMAFLQSWSSEQS